MSAIIDWIFEKCFGIESEATVRRRLEECIPHLQACREDEPGGIGFTNWLRF